ncbi:MAG: hypothetical protein ACLUTU_14835 [Blautia faecis]
MESVIFQKMNIEANAQYRKAQKACRQCIYLGMNIILKYEDLQYEEQKEFVITQGERMHFMMTLFRESFEKAEEELRQLLPEHRRMGQLLNLQRWICCLGA